MRRPSRHYEDWWGRVASYCHEHRPEYDLRLREAQDVTITNPHVIGVGGQNFDLNVPVEFQRRVAGVRGQIREMIDGTPPPRYPQIFISR